jgi:hypothetical protein
MTYVDELRTKLETEIARATAGGRTMPPGEFAVIATDALASFSREALPDPYEILGAMALDRDRGQHPAEHPAASILSLYRSRTFEIHLGSWLDGYVTPHHHDWEGAFQVIDGEAVQAHYSFEETSRIDEHFGIGELVRSELRRISSGDITTVWPDERTIHSVQHFPRGSFSIAIRHLHPGTPFPGYWRPGVRVDLGYPDEVDTRRNKALDILHRTRRPDYLAAQRELVLSGTPLDAWYAMRHASDANDGPAFAAICEAVRQRHGATIEPVIGAIHDKRRSQLFTKFREALRTEHDRRVLAALYYGETRTDVFAVLEQTAPGCEPVATIGAWFESLLDRRQELGPAPLGLALDETSVALFQGLVAGRDADTILAGLRAVYGERVDARRDVLTGNLRTLRAHPAFVGLFARESITTSSHKVANAGTSKVRPPTTLRHAEGVR